jgi:DNA polymerase-3 subunit gamma/tau
VPNQALYLKYRPRVFADMIGQEHITRSLQNALAQNRTRHAYLFSGPRGTGKTTLARILAKAVNCLDPDPHLRPCDVCASCVAVNEGRYLDLIEIDAASNNGVDDVRDLRDKIGFSPNEGRYKVYVIDEVHRFSGAAFDAILKTLEEPPDHAIFILATTELDKVPATIKSRCLKFEFRRVSVAMVAYRLKQIADYEGVSIDPAALELVARQGTGSVRDSISLLDQLIADTSVYITRQDAEQILGAANYQEVGDLAQALIDQDTARGLAILNTALDEGADPRQFGGQMVEHLHNVLLAQVGGAALVDVADEQRAVLEAQASQIGRGTLLKAIRSFNSALGEMRGGWQPQLPLELALVEATRPAVESVPAVETREARPNAPRRPGVSAPQAAPEPEIDEDMPSAPGGISLGDLKKRWPEVIEYLRRTDKNVPLISRVTDHLQLRAVEEDLLIVTVTPNLHSRFVDDTQTILKAIQRVTSVKLKLKIEQGNTPDDIPLAPELTDFMKGKPIKSIRPDTNQ